MLMLRFIFKLIGVIACFILITGTVDTVLAQREIDAEKAAVYKKLLEQKEQERAESDASVPEVMDTKYWYDRGTLLSVYGNTKAAIDAFKQAVKLDPANSDAIFQLGVEYGTLGQYQDAIMAIEQALEINPQKAVFYYGRGWVYLLSGDTEKAVQDFEIAAQKGNQNAIDYLRQQASE